MLTRRGPSLRAVVVLTIGVTASVITAAAVAIAVNAVVALVLASGLLLPSGQTRWLAVPQEDQLLLIPGCPALMPRDRTGSVADYADLVRWGDRSYWRDDLMTVDPQQLGEIVTVVGCNVGDLTFATDRQVAPGPWPDRTATGLSTGTELRTVVGQPTTCRLAALVDGEARVYAAVDADGDVSC